MIVALLRWMWSFRSGETARRLGRIWGDLEEPKVCHSKPSSILHNYILIHLAAGVLGSIRSGCRCWFSSCDFAQVPLPWVDLGAVLLKVIIIFLFS